MKIVVLGGGISTERHVSLVTSTSVCKALRSLGHKAVFIDMFLGLENYSGSLEDIFDVPDGFCGDVSIGHNAPNLDEVIASRKYGDKSRLGKNVLEVCRLADCVFLGLHGADGEDGKIQAALELLGVPYTGSRHLGSAVAMDKIMAKKIMISEGIPTPEYFEFSLLENTDEEILAKVSAPCVVKSVNGGSSIGVYICDSQKELTEALEESRKSENRILIEKKVSGREFTVPILDEKVLSPIEIIPPEGSSFDYVAKYQSGEEGAREICPADISSELKDQLSAYALKFHKVLGLSVCSRTDFILDSSGKVWCLEVNTLPGLTPNSLIPKAAALEGIGYAQLCNKIIELSFNKK